MTMMTRARISLVAAAAALLAPSAWSNGHASELTAQGIEARKATMQMDERLVEALGERGRTLSDFYWRKAQLIEAQQRSIDYGDIITNLPTDRPPPMTLLEEIRVSFAGGRVAAVRVNGGRASPRKAESRRQAAQIEADARSFRRLMQAPRPSPPKGCSWSCATSWDGEPAECRGFVCR